VHTHYDGQATWDDVLEPTASHGVSTLIMGNCGVGFAPMHAKDRDTLIDLMEGVEDIPGTALAEGIPWGQWETFPQYLDFLGTRPFAMDIGGHIPHGALRFFVMGARGVRNEDASADDIRHMALLTREAMEAGALGLSTSRTVFHRSRAGDQPVPGTFASKEELCALTEAMAASGRGVLEAIPSGSLGNAGGKPRCRLRSVGLGQSGIWESK
jgi:N-acyl-D-aspartate/D-glutamate deacylase